MIEQFAQRSRAALVSWIGLVSRLAWPVVLVFGLLTGLAGSYTARTFTVNTDTRDMISSEVEFRQNDNAFDAAFPQFEDLIVAVIEGPTPEDAEAAADRLAEALVAQPELFTHLRRPGAEDFFRENAFLFQSPDALSELADRLAAAEPLLGALSQDMSLRGLLEVLSQALEPAAKAEDPAPLPRVLDAIAEQAEAAPDGGPGALSWRSLLAPDSAPVAARSFLTTQPVLDHASLKPAEKAVTALRHQAAAVGIGAEQGLRMRLTGPAALDHEEFESVEVGASAAGVISLCAVSILLILGLRSVSLVCATILTLLVGLTWTAAFAMLAIGHLNIISVAFAAATVVRLNMVSVAFGVLFVGLGVDFGIHLGMRYAEAIRQGFSREGAMSETARSIGGSLVVCAATTAVGFYVFLPTDFRAVAELGLIAGTGMFVSLVCNFTVLPALLTLGSNVVRPDHRKWLDQVDGALAAFAFRRARIIRQVALAVGLGCAVLLPYASFDHDAVRLRDPSTESVQTMLDLLEERTRSPWNIDVVAPDLESAREIAERLEKLDAVDDTVTILDYVPPEQEEKLEILAALALFRPMDPSVAPALPPASPEEQLAVIADFRDVLRDGWAGSDGDPVLAASAARLAATLDRVLAESRREPASEVLGRLEAQLVGPLPDQLRRFWTALTAAELGVGLDDLPADLSSRMLAPDGRARIQVLPVEDLHDPEAMKRFVADVRGLHPDATGMAVSLLETARVVVRSLRQALVAATIVILLLLLFLWRSPSDALLVMAPLALAAAMTGATTVVLGTPFNFANVIVLPLLLGIGVDSGIHLVHRFRVARAEGSLEAREVMRSSTARAILFSALTTAASFGTMAFTGHQGLASLGRLLTIGILYTVVCNLVVLPAMLAGRTQRQRDDGAATLPAVESRG